MSRVFDDSIRVYLGKGGKVEPGETSAQAALRELEVFFLNSL